MPAWRSRRTSTCRSTSDTAEPLFRKRGYVATQRNTVTLNGEWLANTTMQRTLTDAAAPGGPS